MISTRNFQICSDLYRNSEEAGRARSADSEELKLYETVMIVSSVSCCTSIYVFFAASLLFTKSPLREGSVSCAFCIVGANSSQ